MPDLFGDEPLRVVHPKAYARTPGAGPAGCTCADCAHLFHRDGPAGRRYYKCDRAQHDSTPATDVRKTMPACVCFTAMEADR